MNFKKIVLIVVSVCAFLLAINAIVGYVDALATYNELKGSSVGKAFAESIKPSFFWMLVNLAFYISIGITGIVLIPEITTEKEYVLKRFSQLSKKTKVLETELIDIKSKIKEE